jgi:hypothetical protein
MRNALQQVAKVKAPHEGNKILIDSMLVTVKTEKLAYNHSWE